ncbi:MAG: diguanylate cyclase [Spirochaetales bacterium]|nr:diguanylate cyclase [Spirochaetales bacterium]
MKQRTRIFSKTALFLMILLILTTLHGVVLVYLYSSRYNEYLLLIRQSQENMIEFEQTRIRAELRDTLQDILLLTGIVEESLGNEPGGTLSPSVRTLLDGTFSLLAELSDRYVNIELVSADGEDIYRLVRDGDGGFRQLSDGETVPMASNPFFEKKRLVPDILYLSRLELIEVEGAVRKPPVPVLRIADAVKASDGSVLGYLYMDYDATRMLQNLGKYEILPEESFQTYLINHEGYFLRSPGNYPVFSFQYPGGEEENLSNLLPDIWMEIQSSERGTMDLPGGLFIYRRLAVHDMLPRKDQAIVTAGTPGNRYYYLIYQTPSAVLDFLSSNIIRSLLPSLISVQLIIILLSVLIAQWINRLQRYQQKLLHFSSMDEMTGCMNRRTGRKILENYLSMSRRRGDSLTVVYLDLNRLKTVNDQLGHREGDHYILTMVDLIKEQLRSTDFFIRMGGDEFLLILPDCSAEEAFRIRKRVLVKEYKLNQADIYPYTLGMSWGILEVLPERNVTVAQILAEADEKMYAEKNNYPLVDEKMIKEVEGYSLPGAGERHQP